MALAVLVPLAGPRAADAQDAEGEEGLASETDEWDEAPSGTLADDDDATRQP